MQARTEGNTRAVALGVSILSLAVDARVIFSHILNPEDNIPEVLAATGAGLILAGIIYYFTKDTPLIPKN